MLFTPSETKVVIVGGGTMGADVAAVCARGGCAVQVLEPTTERRALLPDYFANTMIDLGYEHRLHLLSTAGSLEEVDWSEVPRRADRTVRTQGPPVPSCKGAGKLGRGT